MLNLLAQTTTTIVVTDGDAGFWAALGALWLVWLVVAILQIVAMWKLFEKAEEAGWKSIIPFLNMYTMFRIAGRNGWGFLLMFIPFVNIIVLLMLSLDMAKHFGKSTAFGIIGLFFFSTIGYLILGFGDAKYVGEKHA